MSNVDQSHDDIAKSRERPVDAPSLLENGGREGGREGRIGKDRVSDHTAIIFTSLCRRKCYQVNFGY